ncbi:alkaline phosphatase [soil metagenome]
MTHFRPAAAVACMLVAGSHGALTAQSAGASGAARGAVTDHVIVISIDGLRPDAVTPVHARVLSRLMNEGAYAPAARTVSPSRTLPSHTSMLTGVPPSVHGITWNSDRTAEHGAVETPTVFGLAKRHGFTTAAFFSKAKLRHLEQPGTLDHAQAPAGLAVLSAAETVEQAVRYMRFRRPNLLFVHLAEPDAAGHSVGWNSFVYRWAVRRSDGAVGRILATADEVYGAGGYTVIVTADHGGSGRDHGADTDDDMEIPWIAWGAGVRAAGAFEAPVNTMDTAATVLWLLGVDAPANLVGRPVVAAYTAAARQAAADAGGP